MTTLRADILLMRVRDLGIASPRQIEQAKQELSASQERFSAILVKQGLIRDADAGKRLAVQLGSIPQRLDAIPVATPLAARVSASAWRTQRLVPVREADGKLLLATDDPFSVFSLEFLGARCGCALDAVLIREQDLLPLLESLERLLSPEAPPAAIPPKPSTPLQPKPASMGPRISAPGRAEPAKPTGPAAVAQQAPEATEGQHPVAAAPARPPAERLRGTEAGMDTSDEPIIRLVDSMLAEAVRMRASDIHIEPGKDALRVRYRIDGVLHDVTSPPRALHGPIVSRIKILSSVNIAEKRLPQDGRLQLSVEGRPLDVRVSTLPAMYGESVVMRLLDRSQPIRGLQDMGMLPEDQTRWEELIRRPHGMMLVTGPTGSGKTTTLYGALSMLNQSDRKLITVEDPVEYQLAGVNQVLVKSSIGLTFAAGLRAMLRQAPDVIMVGEIRDQETAQIAVQAALTGHLVFSTLHTNDAPSAITRLIDMGIAPFLAASTMQGVLAQRLVRRICPACRITDNATAEERVFLGPPEIAQLIRSNGCDKCHGSGFFGRIGIFELLGISEKIRQLIVTKATASAIRAAAVQEGMRGLREDGIVKIREGLTTMAEVLRVVMEGT